MGSYPFTSCFFDDIDHADGTYRRPLESVRKPGNRAATLSALKRLVNDRFDGTIDGVEIPGRRVSGPLQR